ncbi:hypothetical protein BDY21DRAFT_199780 [Lineolata rhizophorae]|uniref:Uncharacterized protein n=1 Tax=Lineolata rhizophorae TaxID=578093 RepID=A0A6A6P4X4_9PEZI|nr:hypothetical protein BDY21DRAFT_199780 [Lineolata rhizophorae]
MTRDDRKCIMLTGLYRNAFACLQISNLLFSVTARLDVVDHCSPSHEHLPLNLKSVAPLVDLGRHKKLRVAWSGRVSAEHFGGQMDLCSSWEGCSMRLAARRTQP